MSDGIPRATVVGGGLAGSEAAWQLAEAGIEVDLFEMRPTVRTAAHHTDSLAELVCSNSLGAQGLGAASGLLKAELERLGSFVLRCAAQASVPAGGALAVDRVIFGQLVTERIAGHPRIRLHREELREVPEGPVVVATGPLTSEALCCDLQRLIGAAHLHFYDAAAPIVTHESLDLSRIWRQSRYDKGEAAYLNCPLSEAEYRAFHDALVHAEGTVLHLGEEEKRFFEGCLPVEVLASRGYETLRYGPMKPVGLTDPATGGRPYAVVQLRQDNISGELYSMVGFQTQLRWGEQKRVFGMIPGLAGAEFVRLGVMHRNTYLASPAFLSPSMQWRGHPTWFLAGQLVGVEGYTESTAMGLLAGRNLARVLHGEAPVVLPTSTMLGALAHYVTSADLAHFQPMNSNWGILEALPPPSGQPKWRDKGAKREALVARALRDLAGTSLASVLV